ncbi:uncharacterized protein [Solanum lycopersicum]|uniref:uncharacterized protein n=1 Tax=Solanum lycopersicum TaxID=4081 RepID=UPI0037496ECC
MPIRVSTLVGESVIVEKVYRSCPVSFMESTTHVDLVILEMVEFDVILGMTWLSPNFAIFDCNSKTVTLAKPEPAPLVWEGEYTSTPVCIISFIRAKRMVRKCCLAFLAHLRDDTTQVPSIESVPVVREFLDVFPADLPYSPTGVETRIGMSSNSQGKFRLVANEEDTYENVEPGSNNTESMQSQTKRLPVITVSDVSASDRPGKA